MKASKTGIALVATVLMLFALSGCPQPPMPPEDLSGFKNCGSDESCMGDAIGTCEKAYADLSDNSMGVEMKARIVCYGFTEEKCKVKFRINEVTADDPTNPEAFFVKMLEGKEMICNVPEDELQANIQITNNIEEYCTGSLVDLITQMQSMG